MFLECPADRYLQILYDCVHLLLLTFLLFFIVLARNRGLEFDVNDRISL
jgi:hypothetical protein